MNKDKRLSYGFFKIQSIKGSKFRLIDVDCTNLMKKSQKIDRAGADFHKRQFQ